MQVVVGDVHSDQGQAGQDERKDRGRGWHYIH